jgi:uncharacterized protein (DUF1778 family)
LLAKQSKAKEMQQTPTATPREDLVFLVQKIKIYTINYMKQLKREDLIYLAGFVDGDGCIMAQLVPRVGYKFKYQIRLTVQITQSQKREWFLESIKKLIDAGTIRKRKSVSDYVLVEPANVAAFLIQLQPFLRLKKKQANLVLKIIEQLPSTRGSLDKFLETCEIVDQVAALNDQKKRKHTFTTVSADLKAAIKNDVPVETELTILILRDCADALDSESESETS